MLQDFRFASKRMFTTRFCVRRGAAVAVPIDLRRRGCYTCFSRSRVSAFSTQSLDASSVPIYPLESTPELKKVPSLPYVGSLITWHSDLPRRALGTEFEWQLEMRKRFGNFYSYGLPGLGAGTHGTIYCLNDPREYMKVIRSEGRFPFGMASLVWPFIKYSETHRISYTRGEAGGFFGRDTDWRGIRTFLQTDLLSPQSAGGYIPGVIVAAKLASKGAPKCGDDLTSYLNRCAFDMFCTVMFGELVQVADPSTPTDPENLEFIENSVTFLNISTRLMVDPYESLAGRLLNVETNKYKQFVKATSKMMEIGRTKVKRFQKQYELGLLDEYQSRSYLAHAIKRQKEGTGDDVVTDEMMVDLCVLLLTASVDTTSGVMAWVLLHAALNPDVQEKLFEELKANLTSNKTGHLTADVLHKRSNTPYLHAVLRESHRLTPTVPNSIMKEVVSEIEIHGIVLPPKSMVSFANYAIQMDPAYFEEPEEFRPERWLPDAVEARRGTPKEVLDHPFFKDPFSQGSRKCPGSRVAINEVLCLLSQLILDYKIRAPAKVQTYKDVPYTLMGVHSPILPELEFVPRIM